MKTNQVVCNRFRCSVSNARVILYVEWPCRVFRIGFKLSSWHHQMVTQQGDFLAVTTVANRRLHS